MPQKQKLNQSVLGCPDFVCPHIGKVGKVQQRVTREMGNRVRGKRRLPSISWTVFTQLSAINNRRIRSLSELINTLITHTTRGTNIITYNQLHFLRHRTGGLVSKLIHHINRYFRIRFLNQICFSYLGIQRNLFPHIFGESCQRSTCPREVFGKPHHYFSDHYTWL